MEKKNGEARASYRVAYVLCVALGWLGMHRYYLHRWATGLLFTLATATMIGCFYQGYYQDLEGYYVVAATSFGLLVFGVLFDLLTLPLLVRQRRDVEAGIPFPPDKAPWAKDEQKTWWNRFQLLLRIAILVFMPAITIVFAMSLGQTVIVALVFMLLAFSLLVGSIGRGLYALEDMESFTQRVPSLSVALGIVTRFQKHYSEHRGRSVFFYLFYPVLGPLFILFSRAARSEFRPFLSLFSLVIFGVIFQNFINYFKIFPMSYFSWQFGLQACLFLVIGAIGLFFMCVVPIVSSSFYLSMTGRGLSQRTSAALALIISAAAMFWANIATPVTFRGSLTAMEKMNSPVFREEFAWLSDVFLQHEIETLQHEIENLPREMENLPREMDDLDKMGDLNKTISQIIAPELWVSLNWEGGEPANVHVLKKSTASYRTLLAGILRKEEAAAFTVLAIDSPDGNVLDGNVPWLAIQFIPVPFGGGVIGESVLLYVISPDFLDDRGLPRVYNRWSELYVDWPSLTPNRFKILDRWKRMVVSNQLTSRLLIDDIDFAQGIPEFQPAGFQWMARKDK